MIRQIWKYPLEIIEIQEICMPIDAVVLSVQTQRGVPCIWVEVDLTQALEDVRNRKFVIYGTGQPMYHGHGRFVGTFQLYEGALVLHLYEGEAV